MDNERHRPFPNRRSIRLQGYDYSASGAYFLTICTENRRCLLADITEGEAILTTFGEAAKECWQWLERQYEHVQLDEFIVMPNHLHGILVITDEMADS